MTNDEILQAAKEERDRIVTEVMLSHTEEVDVFSYRGFAGRIADEVAAIIEKHTIERCESVLMQLHKKHMRNHNHFHYAALQVAALRKLGEQE